MELRCKDVECSAPHVCSCSSSASASPEGTAAPLAHQSMEKNSAILYFITGLSPTCMCVHENTLFKVFVGLNDQRQPKTFNMCALYTTYIWLDISLSPLPVILHIKEAAKSPHNVTNGNPTRGSRFYSNLLDTSVCIYQLVFKHCSKR